MIAVWMLFIVVILLISVTLLAGAFERDNQSQPGSIGQTQCSNSRDDDGDGHTDYPDDLDCLNIFDNTEAPPTMETDTGTVCGNDSCETGENYESCPQDCLCGDGQCLEPENADNCAADCFCGDGVCDEQETNSNCPADCR